MNKSPGHSASLRFLGFAYWLLLLLIGTIFVILQEDDDVLCSGVDKIMVEKAADAAKKLLPDYKPEMEEKTIDPASVFRCSSIRIGFGLFTFLFLICVVISLKMSKLPVREYYNEIFMCGVRKIAYSCSQLGRPEHAQDIIMWWEPAFALYWGLLVKYVNPVLLYFITIGILKNDIKKPYGNYAWGWQVIGWFLPAFGFALFIISYFLSTSN